MKEAGDMHIQITRDSAGEPAARLSPLWFLLRENRPRGLAALDDLFREGRLPDPPPDGRYPGRFVAFNLGPGLTGLAAATDIYWKPWHGKTFDAATGAGNNLFARDFPKIARLLWPAYRDFRRDQQGTIHGLRFRTWTGPGLADPDVEVLKIDYALEANPPSVRRLLDELIQIGDDFYLGKAHLRRRGGAWQQVAYFTLAGGLPAPPT